MLRKSRADYLNQALVWDKSLHLPAIASIIRPLLINPLIWYEVSKILLRRLNFIFLCYEYTLILTCMHIGPSTSHPPGKLEVISELRGRQFFLIRSQKRFENGNIKSESPEIRGQYRAGPVTITAVQRRWMERILKII